MSLRGNRIVAILREGKNKWERRAPLAPSHVERLVKAGIKVLMQPSPRRAFHDSEYKMAGATLQEDISPASVILGVKEVPPENLIANRTYVFFSHTIKAQSYNMSLLDAILAKNIRLIDYECITERGERNGRRLVSFGRFAGLAGMVDIQRGLGERMLALGYHNPFLNVGSSFMYPNLAAAQDAVTKCGEMIATIGVPKHFGPMIFTFAGDGKVSRGAQEIFSLLPHEMVSVQDLPNLVKDGNADLHKIYGVIPKIKDYIFPNDQNMDKSWTKHDYYAQPHLFHSRFHCDVARYSSVIVNCLFWTKAYARLLTKKHMVDLQRGGRLLAIGDISCDHQGSIECLERFSTIEKPFYLWDAQADMVHENIDKKGILMHAVDTLPAELPVEATMHFGDALLPFLPALTQSNGELDFAEQANSLPKQLHSAIIACNGALTPGFKYIEQLRKQNERISAAAACEAEEGGGRRLLLLRGHLFDNQTINRILDIVEHVDGCSVRILEWTLGSDRNNETTALLELQANAKTNGNCTFMALEQIRTLLSARQGISPTVLRELEAPQITKSKFVDETFKRVSTQSKSMRRVAILGSGMVCAPVVDILYDEGVSLTLCSVDVEEAEAIVGGRSDICCTALDVQNDIDSLDRLVSDVDAVVSLVPAPFHPVIAKICIKHKCHLITASYESPSIASLHQNALDADIAILNEVGLDPGLDHMSAMQVIDEVEDLGGKVRSFRSLCGGLPAPEHANNPLRYKFSWNPLGVLTACQNSARFLLHGATMEVDGDQLLDAVLPVHSDLLPSTPLEQIPNRDSTIYQNAYNLKSASTVYRGTLRYAGYCNIVGQIARVGLLNPDTEIISPKETLWGDYLAQLLQATNGEHARELLFRRIRDTSREGVVQAETTVEAFDYLGLFCDTAMGTGTDPTRVIECLCHRLQDRLAYNDGERDAVLLHHEFIIEDCGGRLSKRSSSLKCFGDPYPAGPSAMATTVGVPTALSTLAILDGSISRRGVFIPTKRDVYGPLLQRLKQFGIAFTEKEEPANTL